MWGFGTFWVATAATGSLYHTRKLKLFKDKVLHMDNVADRCAPAFPLRLEYHVARAIVSAHE
jgi:hypothetical protein